MIKHKHHIIPKHMGGSDDPSNLIELTIEEHAQAHLDLYKKHGRHQDFVAHKMLLGQISRAEAIKELQKMPKSDEWKRKTSERMKGNTQSKGRVKSQEERDKISDALKGRKKSYKCTTPVLYGKDNPKSRAVVVDGVEYESVTAAAKAKKVSLVTARRRLTKDTFPDWNYK
jgi:hypothetical protein